jgi:hypothetical protein
MLPANVEVVTGDLTVPESLDAALRGGRREHPRPDDRRLEPCCRDEVTMRGVMLRRFAVAVQALVRPVDSARCRLHRAG